MKKKHTVNLKDGEIQSLKDDGVTKVIFGLFLSISLLMLATAAISGVIAGRALSREVSTQGNVVELVMRRDSDGNEYYYPVVLFALPDRTLLTVQTSEGSWPAAYFKGEAVIVRYDPARPHKARIQSGSGLISRWILTIITGLLGVCFLAASWLAYGLSKVQVEMPEVE